MKLFTENQNLKVIEYGDHCNQNFSFMQFKKFWCKLFAR